MPLGPRNGVFDDVAGGLADEKPHMISAAVKGLARLVYEFSDLIGAAYNLLPSSFLLLQRKNREIIKANLGLIKVKLLLEMLVRKCGVDAVRAVMPEEHMKLLTNIRKWISVEFLPFAERGYDFSAAHIVTPFRSKEKSVSVCTGNEYTNKKSSGDVKKKDKLDPYAYWPLDRKLLNRRVERKASARKGMASVMKFMKKFEGKSASAVNLADSKFDVGTADVTRIDGRLALGRLGSLCEQVKELNSQGLDVILVTSGAVSVGR
ncbi:uncharacterized protein A4U43_C07F26270 [Asparagus officinalis]|uniref:Uncharacterized protein n=1 Tax=Asparagus officinalis TaxID=4686 RepID=A0A5P1EK83_ASPOF|nr:uncharacterized protein A4U43_C07F26270 [Asparagus officinalis]